MTQMKRVRKLGLGKATKCYCENYIYDHEQAPLSRDVMAFLDCVRHITKNCALAGGAVLAQMLYQNRRCRYCLSMKRWNVQMNQSNTDIDFFVHQYPSSLNKFYGQSVNEYFGENENRPKKFFHVLREIILPWFNHTHRYSKKGPLEITRRRLLNLNEDYVINGMEEIIELSFRNGQQKLQIIVIKTFPEINVPWTNFIVDQFDIDIVRNKVRGVDSEKLPVVKFVHPSALNSLKNCSFRFVIRPTNPFEIGLKRILKYKQRGFSVGSITFNPQVSAFWKQYWMGRFHLLFLPFWCEEMIRQSHRHEHDEDGSDVASFIAKKEAVCKLIGEFVWKPPTRRHYHNKLREQVNMERQRQMDY